MQQPNTKQNQSTKRLPTTKTMPVRDPNKLIWFIYGVPKIGKSEFASQFDSPLFLDTEGGLKSLSTYEVSINSWEEFLEVCNELSKGEHQFKTVVIDTIQYLYRFCLDYICRIHNFSYPGDEEWGKGWSVLRDEFVRVMIKLAKIGLGIVMISHGKTTELKSRTGMSFTRTQPDLSGIARQLVLGVSDIIFYMEKQRRSDGTEHVIVHSKPSDMFEAGDRSKVLPATMDYSEKLFSKIKELFNAKAQKELVGSKRN